MDLIKRNKGQSSAIRRSRSPLSSFFEDLDTLLSPVLSTGMDLVPSANIKETENEYKVELAAPGLSKEDFHLNVENNMLSIHVDKEQEKEEKEEGYTRREYNYKSFVRTFNLPESVASDKIEAKYENGILNLTLPKKEEAKKGSQKREIAIS